MSVGLEHQSSIVEHVHCIPSSTGGAACVRLFHNIPHLGHTATSHICEKHPGWLWLLLVMTQVNYDVSANVSFVSSK